MTLELFDLYVIILAGVGQTVFVCMWAVLPWWREWIGRALMTKSLALMLFIDVSVLFLFVDWAYERVVETVIHVLVMAGIWLQVFALGREKRRANTGRRSVSGTSHLGDDNDTLRAVVTHQIERASEYPE